MNTELFITLYRLFGVIATQSEMDEIVNVVYSSNDEESYIDSHIDFPPKV